MPGRQKGKFQNLWVIPMLLLLFGSACLCDTRSFSGLEGMGESMLGPAHAEGQAGLPFMPLDLTWF